MAGRRSMRWNPTRLANVAGWWKRGAGRQGELLTSSKVSALYDLSGTGFAWKSSLAGREGNRVLDGSVPALGMNLTDSAGSGDALQGYSEVTAANADLTMADTWQLYVAANWQDHGSGANNNILQPASSLNIGAPFASLGLLDVNYVNRPAIYQYTANAIRAAAPGAVQGLHLVTFRVSQSSAKSAVRVDNGALTDVASAGIKANDAWRYFGTFRALAREIVLVQAASDPCLTAAEDAALLDYLNNEHQIW